MTSLWFESALLPNGWASHVRVTATNGRIERVTADIEPNDRDERLSVGIPGLPNLHSHAFQRGIAGLTERRGAEGDSFWTWRELMYQFVDRITPDQMESVASLAYAEMLESGFTQVGEFHYLHHDRGGVPFADPGELAGRLAAAAANTGIGLTLLPTMYAHSGFGGAEPGKRQSRFICTRDQFAAIVEASRKVVATLPGGVVGVAPHSLRAVTPDELAWLVELSRGSVMHIHIAEQTKEVDDCLAWCGRRPVEWLLDNTAVDERWCLVHATHLTDAEIQGVAASGAVVGLCPITEANLGDGIFPAKTFLERDGRIGIGSDSNVLIDAAEEIRLLEYSQRFAHRGRNVLASGAGKSTGRTLYDRSLAGGAKVLGSSAGLVSGALLDVVSLKTSEPHLTRRRQDDILDTWIFSGGQKLVDCVWRAGEKVVVNGRHRHRDAIVARYRRALESLLT
ncbi:MAG: formimidoylglutamate deiminase [Proteobacteria bacterium]|nr:formimidoylglutamate deiminase [Pseudomonadota bacterium]